MKNKITVICAVMVTGLMILVALMSALHIQDKVKTVSGKNESSEPESAVTSELVTERLRERYDNSVKYVGRDTQGDFILKAEYQKPEAGSFVFLVKGDNAYTDNYDDMLYQKLTDTFKKKQTDFGLTEWKNEEKLNFDTPVLTFKCYDRSNMTEAVTEIADLYDYLMQNETLSQMKDKLPDWYLYVGASGKPKCISPAVLMKQYDRTGYTDVVYTIMDQTFSGESVSEGSSDEASTESPAMFTTEELKALWDGMCKDTDLSCKSENGKEYRMINTDAACGSRAYTLIVSDNHGKNVQLVNANPTNEMLGTMKCFQMFDDGTGYISEIWNGGSDGELLRTEDGGKSFTLSDLPSPKAKLPDGTYYNPFAVPQMPEKHRDELTLIVKQSEDSGDYKGGRVAGQYTSDDNGKTWKYAGEIEK